MIFLTCASIKGWFLTFQLCICCGLEKGCFVLLKFPTHHYHWSQQGHIASCPPWTFLANCVHSVSSSSCYSDLEDGGNMFLTITGKEL
jgi:hypothetical protein